MTYDDDKVTNEYPVYIARQDLSLLYFPLSAPPPPQDSVDDEDNRIQLKPVCQHVQLQLGSRKYYGSSIGDLKTFQFVSTLQNGKLLLHPVENIYALRPLVPQQQSDSHNSKPLDIEAEEDGKEEGPAKPVLMIRKKETEAQTRERESSYVFIRKTIDEEPWIFMNLTSGDIDSLK